MKENDAEQSHYEIKIVGHLKESWVDWFNGMVTGMHYSDRDANDTTITVLVPDQAALRGLLNKLWDLNLSLISVISQDNCEMGAKNEN
jgi:hypothetical protein